MTGLFISVIIPAKALRIQQLKERRIVMTTIDKAKTGQQIRLLMEKRGVTVRDVMLVCGNRRYDPKKNIPEGAERLFRYYRLIQDCMAA